MDTITRTVVQQAGGPAAISRQIGISRQAISQWHVVPAKYVIALEKMSGISRHVIRADIFGEGQATHD